MADKFIFVQAKMKAPYMVADAAMRVWIHMQLLTNLSIPLRWKYFGETSGTSIHRIMDSNNRVLIAFTLEAIAAQETLITVHGIEGQSSEDDLRQFLGLFHHGWATIQQEHEKVEPIEDMPNPPHLPNITRTVPKRGGAPTKDYNDWAREQIQAGRDRKTVFLEWLSRRGLDSRNPDVRQQYSDAFRKAISRSRKS